MRKLVAHSQCSIRDHSKQIFERLLDTKRPTELLLDFLDEISFNENIAINLRLFLFRRIEQQFDTSIFENEISLLAPWMKVQLSLGKLSSNIIHELVDFLLALTHRRRGEQPICQVAEAIVEGVNECTVLGFSDISIYHLGKLLKSLALGPCSGRAQSLGGRLLGLLGKPLIARLEGVIALFMHRSLVATIEASLKRSETDLQIKETVAESFARLIKPLPEPVNVSVAAWTNRLLLQESVCGNHQEYYSLCEIWWSILAENDLLYNPESRRGLDLPKLLAVQKFDVIASFSRHLDHRSLAQLILEMWWPLSIETREMFTDRLRQTNSAYCLSVMMKIAHDSKNPIHYFVMQTFNLLEMMQQKLEIVRIVKSASSHDYILPSSVIIACVKDMMPKDPYMACCILAADPRPLIESTPAYAEQVMLAESVNPGCIWKCFIDKSRPRINRALRRSHFDLRRKARSGLLLRMAMAFSIRQKDLSAANAFGHLVKCYSLHKREHLGDTGPLMSRSLVKVGLILPLQRNQIFSKNKLKFVLSVVGECEGQRIADEIDEIISRWRDEVARRIERATKSTRLQSDNWESPMT